MSKEKLVCVSGGFDPVHIGHLRMIEEAAKYGHVVVIVNSDQVADAQERLYFYAISGAL